MVAATVQPSLIDDWRRRRHRLAGQADTHPQARFQVRLLDYLIRRFGDTPVANAPARFALGGAARLTGRAIVVHQELSRRTAQVRNQRDAQHRVACCRGGGVVEHADWAWRRRVAAGKIDETTNELRQFLLRVDVREEAAERMRSALADQNAAVRLEATAFLGRIGSLDDVGLLSDLLALPPTADEGPMERKGLLLVMQRISQR